MDVIPNIPIETLIGRYEVLLFDAYGVLVHSGGALPGAAELIGHLNRTGKAYYVLTNDASRLPVSAARHYQSFGLPVSQDRIITSGELIRHYFESHGLAGARCTVLGPEDSLAYVRRAGGQIVPATELFDVLVIADETGYSFFETVNTALSTLFHVVDRGQAVHLVLPNPDLVFPLAAGQFGFTSGSIALIFEAILRQRYPGRPDLCFVHLGKPHAEIFAEAVRRSASRNMVMIGDQLETDIRGATAFGLDSALVSTGVTPADMVILSPEMRPTYHLHSLHLRRHSRNT